MNKLFAIFTSVITSLLTMTFLFASGWAMLSTKNYGLIMSLILLTLACGVFAFNDLKVRIKS
jgi:hypothetical protein